MGVQPPYLYDSGRRDSRLPQKEFDPKAVTRASWEVKPKKPKHKGPLVAFGRHPDAHAVLTGRTYNFRVMSETSKWFIRWTRYFQIVLRALELIVGAGLLTLMILISGATPLAAWILRIAPGVIVLCSAYAISHLARPARARPPASSAAYQLFAGTTDLAILAFYAFGTITVLKESGNWGTIVENKTLLPIFIKSEFYGLISALGLHAISLGISIYLFFMFKSIASMPPDMNPLESNLTSRTKHKRNKSSVASSYTAMSESNKRLSTPLEGHRRSGAPYEDLSRPPSVPFMHTRKGSQDTFVSSNRDSRGDLPSRQYQVTPGNSPRNSLLNNVTSPADQKRKSNPRLAQRGSYIEVPLHETGSPSRPSSAVSSQPINASPTRPGRFTEAWYASESLINRTQQRMNATERTVAERSKAYEALDQRYEDNESDSEREDAMRPDDVSDLEDDDGPISMAANMHPNPLRQNPHAATPPREAGGSAQRRKVPFGPRDSPLSQPVLTEMSSNRRSVSGSQDIADVQPAPAPARRPTILGGWGRNKGNRNSSIQADEQFYSKPYGELKSATPPIPYGEETRAKGTEGRQVSSGNDYDLGSAANLGYRRKVSGVDAEEGRAGPTSRYSRYSVLNE